MATIVKTKIVRIGNSQGIRIPKYLLEQVNMGDEIELEVQDEEIVIRSARKVREGWEKAFKEMSRQGDDKLLEGMDFSNTWDEEEWEW